MATRRQPIAKPKAAAKKPAPLARKPPAAAAPPPKSEPQVAVGAPKPKHAGGRPPYVPKDGDAALVRNLVAGGTTQARICAMLNISLKTLRLHYAEAIRIGQGRIDAISISALVKAMNAGGSSGVAAAKWWQQARMGWTERVIVDDGKPADTPMRVIVELVGDAPKTTGHGHEQPRQRPGFDVGKHVQLVG